MGYSREVSLHARSCTYKCQEAVDNYWDRMVQHLLRGLPTTCRMDAVMLLQFTGIWHNTKYLYPDFWEISLYTNNFIITRNKHLVFCTIMRKSLENYQNKFSARMKNCFCFFACMYTHLTTKYLVLHMVKWKQNT